MGTDSPQARIIKEEFSRSYKCINTDRETKQETINKHINLLVEKLEKLRVLLNVNYHRLTQAHKAAAEAFFSDAREKLLQVASRKRITINIPKTLHEEIVFTPLSETPENQDEKQSDVEEPQPGPSKRDQPSVKEPVLNRVNMSQTVVEFLNSASRLIPDFDGSAENLQSFLDALNLVDSIKGTHEGVAINLIKTKLRGSARNLISTEQTLAEVIERLRATVKGESVDVVTAKIMSIRQQGKTANSYAKDIEELTKKLETAYISDGLPYKVASTYATNTATKAIIKNAANDRVKLVMEAGTFTNLNEVLSKFINSCTEAYGQPNSILAISQNTKQMKPQSQVNKNRYNVNPRRPNRNFYTGNSPRQNTNAYRQNMNRGFNASNMNNSRQDTNRGFRNSNTGRYNHGHYSGNYVTNFTTEEASGNVIRPADTN